MINSQKRIYNWLLKTPGYIKKSVYTIGQRLHVETERNIQIALKKARVYSKK